MVVLQNISKKELGVTQEKRNKLRQILLQSK